MRQTPWMLIIKVLAFSGVLTLLGLYIDNGIAVALLALVIGSVSIPLILDNRKKIREEKILHGQEVVRLEGEIAQLRRENHELTQKLVDERVRAMTHELRNEMGKVSAPAQVLQHQVENAIESVHRLTDEGKEAERNLAERIERIEQTVQELLMLRKQQMGQQQK